MIEVEIRLLGGFQATCAGEALSGFESQKVRALLAHLACFRDRPLARERLAALLWPEEDEAAARRNLRQAIYNLRQALDESGGAALLATHQALQLDPAVWVDVAAFDQAVAAGLRLEGDLQVRELNRASQLYRGDFLAGFHLHAGEAFEEWLVGEQERLREAAIQALRLLADTLAARGDWRSAIRQARRLIELDPLSEEAHRLLMELYARSGRRARALAQYEDLAGQLKRELGIEPLAETERLYRKIAGDRLAGVGGGEPTAEPAGPYVKLVGRDEAVDRLERSFRRTLEQGARLALVEGEVGIGKTRLVRSLLHRSSTGREARVLQGRCYASAPPRSYELFAEAVCGADWEEAPPGARQRFARLTAALPVPAGLEWPSPVDPAPGGAAGDDPAELVVELLAELCGGSAASADAVPMLLFLDDLHWSDRPSCELIGRLLERLADRPLWLVATFDPERIGDDHPLATIIAGPSAGRIDRVRLERLPSAPLAEIAGDLVPPEQAAALAAFLDRHCEGLPLRIVELINFLGDEGAVVPAGDGRRWMVSGQPALAEVTVPASLEALVRRRVSRLPTSARQLLTLAAVIGLRFDIGLLQRAAEEHIGVVEIGVELMLERWLIRQFPHYWTPDPRERDLVLWARGARRGAFEFASYRIRDAVYDDIEPARRRRLHAQVAAACADSGEDAAEILAHHWAAAADWPRALPALLAAAGRAAGLGDHDTAGYYCSRARRALERLHAAGDPRPDERGTLAALESELGLSAG